ncbi:uncharacterized protein LOC129593516 [Paramacrobiotus metropolitanus]|uniref:uncharacterized protein LOC129593516 n=1 Tax=Paramacrobiotus metropolitanus TaxID=2943436 RepID=UPI0024462448|nr:uncharacterized protein LOC129593516 [Paramacrobiotus metropolitanus]
MALMGRVLNVGRFGWFALRSNKGESLARRQSIAADGDLLIPSGLLLALAGVGLCTFSCHQMSSTSTSRSFPYGK